MAAYNRIKMYCAVNCCRRTGKSNFLLMYLGFLVPDASILDCIQLGFLVPISTHVYKLGGIMEKVFEFIDIPI